MRLEHDIQALPLALSLILFHGVCAAQTLAPAPESEPAPAPAPPSLLPQPTLYPAEVFTLENGLEVVLQRDLSTPRVAVAVSYAVGERDQPDGYRGLAHLTERSMANGSRNVETGEFYRRLERAGATEISSWTLADSTNFSEVLPASSLELALWLESDRMTSMLHRLDEAAVQRLRESLRRDVREGLAQSAVTGMEDVIQGIFYSKTHPYRRLGADVDDIDHLRLEHVRWFFQRFYAPRNARLAIVGDFEPERARELVERYFATIRESSIATRAQRSSSPGEEVGRRRVTIGALTTARTVRVIWSTPPYLEPGDAELDFIAYALGHGRRSRLHRRLVRDMQAASAVYSWQHSRQLASFFRVQVQLTPEGDHAAVVEAIREEVARLCEEPLTWAQVLRIQAMNRTRELVESESLSARAQMMARIRSPLAEDGVFRVEDNLTRYDAVTPESIREAACEHLQLDNRLIVFVSPYDRAGEAGTVLSDEVEP